MSYTVRIDYAVPADIVTKIEAHLDHVARTDVNFNGATFDIVRDEFTAIDEEGYDTARLHNAIQRIIAGEEFA